MDTICGVGLPELLFLAVFSFIVIGPERTRSVALSAGRWLGKAMKAPWWREFMQISQALRNLPQTLVRMAEIEETQADLERSFGDIARSASFDASTDQGSAPSQDPWGVGTIAPPRPKQSSGQTEKPAESQDGE